MSSQTFDTWDHDNERTCNAPVFMFWIAFMLWTIGNSQSTQIIVYTNNTTEVNDLTEADKIASIVFQGIALLLFFVNSLSACTGYIYIPSIRRIDDLDGKICSCTDCCCPNCKIRPYLGASLFFVLFVSCGIMISISNWYILETPLL